MTLLQEKFPGRVVSRRGDINWPSRLCDVTALDFFVELRKKRVSEKKPPILKHLKTNVRQVMAKMSPNMCPKVVKNYFKRINACNT